MQSPESIPSGVNDWTPKDVQEEKDEQDFRVICQDMKEAPELTKRDILSLLGLLILIVIGYAIAQVIS
jgi:hypothetical protein